MLLHKTDVGSGVVRIAWTGEWTLVVWCGNNTVKSINIESGEWGVNECLNDAIVLVAHCQDAGCALL